MRTSCTERPKAPRASRRAPPRSSTGRGRPWTDTPSVPGKQIAGVASRLVPLKLSERLAHDLPLVAVSPPKPDEQSGFDAPC